MIFRVTHDACHPVVDCTGISARAALRDLRAVRGEMLELHAPDVALTRSIRLLHPRFPVYIVPRGAGRYMVGATMIESDDAGGITARAVMELLSAAYTVHPGFAEGEVITTAAGLRPSFPNNLPAIRHVGDVIHVNGMYRHGFLMAPALALDLVTRWKRAAGDVPLIHLEAGLRIVMPLHLNPVVREAILPIVAGEDNIYPIEPLPYRQFCRLMIKAHLIVSAVPVRRKSAALFPARIVTQSWSPRTKG